MCRGLSPDFGVRHCSSASAQVLDFWQHAAEYFEPEVFLVTQPVSPALNHTDLVVESFHEAQRHFVFRLAVSSDTIPMGVDHLSEILVRLQALPLELIAPVLEEFPRPGFPVVVPELTSALDLLAHVLHLECLDGSPIEKVFLRHILDRGRSTAPTDVESKALGVERVVGQPVELLLLHPLAARAVDPPNIELKVDTYASRRKIPDPAQFADHPLCTRPQTPHVVFLSGGSG